MLGRLRVALLTTCVLALLLSLGAVGFAQEAVAPAPAPAPAGPPGMPGPRGPGFYFSVTKLTLLMVTFWLWVFSTDWISRDTQRLKHNWTKWNAAAFGFGMLGFAAALLIPFFFIGYPLLLAAWIVPLRQYIVFRNEPLPRHEKVMTPEHIRYVLAKGLRRLGIKIKAELKSDEELEPFKFTPMGAAKETDNLGNLVVARQSGAFPNALEVLELGLANGANVVLMDLTAGGTTVRYGIDGLWEAGPSLDAQTGVATAAVYKKVANLNVQDNRSRQTGKFGVQRRKKKLTVDLLTQGTQTGARLLLKIEGGIKLDTTEQLGFSQFHRDRLKEVFRPTKGLILISAPPNSGGLTTNFDGIIRSADRYTRGWVGIDDVQHNEKALENVTQTKYDSTKGESIDTVLPKILREYPDVFVVRHMPNAATFKTFLGPSVQGENRLVITSLRAKEAAEAPFRVLSIKDPDGAQISPAELAPHLIASINVRLVRKLCEECKEAYEPTPQMLAQMRLAPNSVKQFFRVPTPDPNVDPKKRKICEACAGRGYKGRTAMVEILEMTDPLREVLVKTPRVEALRNEARKAGMKNLMDDGIRLIAEGVTSLEEVSRCLKEG